MDLIFAAPRPVTLRLQRDLTRSIKRGHPWVFADALRSLPKASPGVQAILHDNKKGRPIAVGFYDPTSPLAFRVCSPEPDMALTDDWAARQLQQALALRQTIIGSGTSGYRLFNGEGDGLPGLICDIYGNVAVLQLDGAGPAGFWRIEGVAEWLTTALPLNGVYLKSQGRQPDSGRTLAGRIPADPVVFTENDVHFTVNIIDGQKTGFFLDQRLNRQLVGKIAANRRVLNLFGYTGGFSVYAGLGGATQVTTVDVAQPALYAAERHWHDNGLSPTNHQIRQADAFAYLEEATSQKGRWELVIVDPPSFASAKHMVKKAKVAYRTLFAAAARVTTPNGLLAVASCSSHISQETFAKICEESISAARRRAIVVAVQGQPPDHPSPLVLPEFRYLKFVLMRVE